MQVEGYRIGMFDLFRGLGPKVLSHKTIEQIWWRRKFLGLRCELGLLPPIRPANIKRITMMPCDSSKYDGFARELEGAKGSEYLEVLLRAAMCDRGVETLYVADGPDGAPVYAQWLITSENQHLLHAQKPGRYPNLGPGEVLVEGAYTFVQYRRTGVMVDGMAQLLYTARDQGAKTAFTYVAPDNLASLRGCGVVGFLLDHVRTNVRRLGVRSSHVTPVDSAAQAAWDLAMQPKRRRRKD
jgi:hypothetical protein